MLTVNDSSPNCDEYKSEMSFIGTEHKVNKRFSSNEMENAPHHFNCNLFNNISSDLCRTFHDNKHPEWLVFSVSNSTCIVSPWRSHCKSSDEVASPARDIGDFVMLFYHDRIREHPHLQCNHQHHTYSVRKNWRNEFHFRKNNETDKANVMIAIDTLHCLECPLNVMQRHRLWTRDMDIVFVWCRRIVPAKHFDRIFGIQSPVTLIDFDQLAHPHSISYNNGLCDGNNNNNFDSYQWISALESRFNSNKKKEEIDK